MNSNYLQLSYHNGKLMAGYLYLAKVGTKSVRSREVESGLVVDFAEDGRPLGIEITSPSVVSIDAIQRVLKSLNLPDAVTTKDLAPLTFAA